MAVEEAEFQRAKERITLKHKNTSRWARRALKRGINLADEGTKDALYEQMRLGRELREKATTMRDDAASSGDSDARCADSILTCLSCRYTLCLLTATTQHAQHVC